MTTPPLTPARIDERKHEPVAWMYRRPGSDLHVYPDRCDEGECAEEDGWTETPLYGPDLLAAYEEMRRERDAQKSRGDNHWETLRSIRKMARKGDCERIVLWVDDAGSGYTATAEATLVEAYDQRNAAEARATALSAENERLRAAAGVISKALKQAEYQPGDSPVLPVKVACCIDAIRATLSGLATAPADEGWKTMDSAPRDGREVLLYAPATTHEGKPGAARLTFGHWEVETGGVTEHRDLDGKWTGQDEYQPWEGWVSFDGGFTEEHLPTRWHDLPAPPKDGGAS